MSEKITQILFNNGFTQEQVDQVLPRIVADLKQARVAVVDQLEEQREIASAICMEEMFDQFLLPTEKPTP